MTTTTNARTCAHMDPDTGYLCGEPEPCPAHTLHLVGVTVEEIPSYPGCEPVRLVWYRQHCAGRIEPSAGGYELTTSAESVAEAIRLLALLAYSQHGAEHRDD